MRPVRARWPAFYTRTVLQVRAVDEDASYINGNGTHWSRMQPAWGMPQREARTEGHGQSRRVLDEYGSCRPGPAPAMHVGNRRVCPLACATYTQERVAELIGDLIICALYLQDHHDYDCRGKIASKLRKILLGYNTGWLDANYVGKEQQFLGSWRSCVLQALRTCRLCRDGGGEEKNIERDLQLLYETVKG